MDPSPATELQTTPEKCQSLTPKLWSSADPPVVLTTSQARLPFATSSPLTSLTQTWKVITPPLRMEPTSSPTRATSSPESQQEDFSRASRTWPVSTHQEFSHPGPRDTSPVRLREVWSFRRTTVKAIALWSSRSLLLSWPFLSSSNQETI